jgi:hypothetical protein
LNRLFSSIVFVIPCLNHFRLNVNNSKAASQLLPIENPLFNACTFILAQVIMSNSYIYIYWLYFAIELLGCNTVIVYYIAFHCTYYSCMSIYRTWDLMVFEELYDDIRTPCCVVDPHPRTPHAQIAVLARSITLAPQLGFLTFGCCKQYLEMKLCWIQDGTEEEQSFRSIYYIVSTLNKTGL